MRIMGDYMNNLMYAMEHSYSEMKIEIGQILKKKDYTAEDENSIFYIRLHTGPQGGFWHFFASCS